MEILRTNEVANMLKISLPTLWRKRRKGDFPPPVRLGKNSIGWLRSDVEAWVEKRIARKDVVVESEVKHGN